MSPEALTFDALLADEAKHDAIARAGTHADPEWFTAALEALHSLASRRSFLSADDLWVELVARRVELPHEPRALANVLLRGKREGWIAPTDRTVRCRRPSRHATSIRLWQSTIEGPKA